MLDRVAMVIVSRTFPAFGRLKTAPRVHETGRTIPPRSEFEEIFRTPVVAQDDGSSEKSVRTDGKGRGSHPGKLEFCSAGSLTRRIDRRS